MVVLSHLCVVAATVGQPFLVLRWTKKASAVEADSKSFESLGIHSAAIFIGLSVKTLSHTFDVVSTDEATLLGYEKHLRVLDRSHHYSRPRHAYYRHLCQDVSPYYRRP